MTRHMDQLKHLRCSTAIFRGMNERYSQKPGFARIVDVAPAILDTSALPAGEAFAVEFKVTGAVGELQVLPVMDRIEIIFE